MEEKRYSKLVPLSLILAALLLVLIIAGFVFEILYHSTYGIPYIWIVVALSEIVVSIISLFIIKKHNLKGKRLAIFTLVWPIILLILLACLFLYSLTMVRI